MSSAQGPVASKQQAFVAKLNEFRGTLTAPERQMLDEIVTAARGAPEQGDVSAYWFTAGLSGGDTRPPGVTTDIWTGYGDQGPWSNKPI